MMTSSGGGREVFSVESAPDQSKDKKKGLQVLVHRKVILVLSALLLTATVATSLLVYHFSPHNDTQDLQPLEHEVRIVDFPVTLLYELIFEYYCYNNCQSGYLCLPWRTTSRSTHTIRIEASTGTGHDLSPRVYSTRICVWLWKTRIITGRERERTRERGVNPTSWPSSSYQYLIKFSW